MPHLEPLDRLYAAREAAWDAVRLADLGTHEASLRACEHFQACRAAIQAALIASQSEAA